MATRAWAKLAMYVINQRCIVLALLLQVDLDNWDSQAHPQFGTLTYYEVILAPGDAIYIPPKWWHYAKSLSISFSVSFWWK